MLARISSYLFGDSSTPINGITYGVTAGKWFAVGDTASGSKIYQSPNGINWSDLSIPDIGELLGCAGTDAATNRGHLVVITSSKIYEMDNAGSWTDVTPGAIGSITKITYLSGVGFCVLYSGSLFKLSTDGVTWISASTTVTSLTKLISATPGFLAYKAGRISYSADGGIWTDVAAFVASNDAVTFHPVQSGWFSVIPQTSPNNHFTVNKSDFIGENWSIIFTSDEGVMSVPLLMYHSSSDKLFIIPGSASIFQALGSTDGTSWDDNDVKQFPFLLTWTGIFTNGVKAVLIGNDGFGQPRGIITLAETGSYSEADFTNDFSTQGGSDPPENLGQLDASWDGNNAEVTFQFTLNNDLSEEISGILIARDGEIVGTPTYTGDGTYQFTDTWATTVDPTGSTYHVYVFSNTLDDVSDPSILVVAFPDITVVGSGGIEFGGAATIVLIANPSGIYTLVPGQTHDILYERSGSVDTIEVAIPEPFIETAYLGND